MNGSTMNYNVTTGATHKFYCSSTVVATISSTTTTFNNAVTCGSNALTCGALTSGAHTSGVITFPNTMTLGSDLTGARIILYGNPATGNDWYGFGMNGGSINYNNVATGTHKFYCGTAVAATISSAATTFNNAVTCGSNAFSCGA